MSLLRRKPEPPPDRLPPHSIEAEQGLLGCVLLDSQTALPEAQAGVTNADAFYDLKHRAIWETCCALADELTAVDLVTVQQRLRDKGKLETIGGLEYLAKLPDTTPSAANVGYYVGIIREKWQLRRLVRACTEIVGRIYSDATDPQAIIDRAEREVLGARLGPSANSDYQSIRELVAQSLQDFDEQICNPKRSFGIATGIQDLDRATDGLQAPDMIVCAAFPSGGKSALCGQLAVHAGKQGVPVGFFSFEMRGLSIVKRMLSNEARVNLRTIRENLDGDVDAMRQAADVLVRLPIHLFDCSGWSLDQLRAMARRAKHDHDIKLLVVDYIQKIRVHGRGQFIQNRTEEIATVSDGIKNLCAELDVVGLVASQLTETDGGKVRLRGAGEIGQDADGVWMLEDQKILRIKKQRGGPRDKAIKLRFIPEFTRFEGESPVSSDELPMGYRSPMND
jgi:replicative DNA helicase